ncbi:hypothetical protein [uncultured Helcococcus sp.]|uniref:hypothetical protein n=1 Tax=uncultured Helcococcus sp. TaxID=1072508 RepID=UPI00261D6B67|nr:hypothetical protein [uncultured Helcococcus sp.]
MKRKDWPRWLTNKNIEKYNYASFVGYQEGYFTIILEDFNNQYDKKKIKVIWDNIYSYTVANESYREDMWIEDNRDYWPFYKLEDSPAISNFKSINTIYQDGPVFHYIIVGEEVVEVLTDKDPEIIIIDNENNAIKEFSEITGEYVDKINGQTRFGFSLSENEDFYDIQNIMEHDGYYKGSVIKFYDFEKAEVSTPFELEKNIQYGSPIYIDYSYYFLRADYNKKLVTIYEYYPQKYLNQIKEFEMDKLNLYNLGLVGEELHLVSDDNKLEIYYPYRKTIDLNGNESLLFIKDNKLYIFAWIEEGWDEENWGPGPDYEYYHKFMVKDLDGKTISEKRGDLFQHIDGTWWLS